MGEKICKFGGVLYVFCPRVLLTNCTCQKTHIRGSENGLDEKKNGDHVRGGKAPPLENNEYFKAPRREVDKGRDNFDLVKRLMHRFGNRPHCFHLEWSPGVSPPDNVIYWVVSRTTYCSGSTRLDRQEPSTISNVRLTDCCCDLYRGNKSHNPWHLAYQEPCLKLVKAYTSLFEELSQSSAEYRSISFNLEHTFLNFTQS